MRHPDPRSLRRHLRVPPVSTTSAALIALAALVAGCTHTPLPPQAPMTPVPAPMPAPAPAAPAPVAPPATVAPPGTVRAPNLAAFSTRLDGRNEMPPVPSMGTGTLDAVLDRSTGLLRWKLSYSNLSGPVTAAHFHGPADVGVNAPPVIALRAPLDAPYEGQATLSPEQRAELLAGRWYINLHTDRFPEGELRGQLIERR